MRNLQKASKLGTGVRLETWKDNYEAMLRDLVKIFNNSTPRAHQLEQSQVAKIFWKGPPFVGKWSILALIYYPLFHKMRTNECKWPVQVMNAFTLEYDKLAAKFYKTVQNSSKREPVCP